MAAITTKSAFCALHGLHKIEINALPTYSAESFVFHFI